jgi:hypothetical protein
MKITMEGGREGSHSLLVHRAAKVDDSPAVGAGQPHHVAGLEVAVHVPRRMELHHPLSDMIDHLHNKICLKP